MADNSILIPGYQDETQLPNNSPAYEEYLLKDNFLSEYSTEGEKSMFPILSHPPLLNKFKYGSQILEINFPN